MADDGGVLGNLPNSRPGKRSAKRDAGGAGAAKAAGKASPKAPHSRPRTTAAKGPGTGDAVRVDPDIRGKGVHDPVPLPASEDPVGAVVRTGASVVGAGLKVAEGVTRELFRRLPRP
jgi:hypothetical protein